MKKLPRSIIEPGHFEFLQFLTILEDELYASLEDSRCIAGGCG
jgi:hypothetical protein